MRILYTITRGDTIAGAQRNVVDLATHFRDVGEVVVASSGEGGPLAQELAARSIAFEPIEALAPRSGLSGVVAATRSLDRLFERLQPDIAHAHSTKAGLLTRLVARRRQVPCVFTAHGWAFTTGTPPVHRLLGTVAEILARPLGAHVVTVSEHDLALGRRWRMAPEDRLHLVEYGIPELVVPPATVAEKTDGKLQLFMTARFERQKDHETLLRGLAMVQDLPWHLTLPGEGPLRPAMEALAVSLGIAQRVDFPGYVSNAGQFLNDATCYVLITNYEGLPISILEALRAGRPVIATDVGGISQMVLDGETGYLVDRGDPWSCAEAFRRALSDPGWLEDAGRAARRRFDELFSVGRMIERMSTLYEGIAL